MWRSLHDLTQTKSDLSSVDAWIGRNTGCLHECLIGRVHNYSIIIISKICCRAVGAGLQLFQLSEFFPTFPTFRIFFFQLSESGLYTPNQSWLVVVNLAVVRYLKYIYLCTSIYTGVNHNQLAQRLTHCRSFCVVHPKQKFQFKLMSAIFCSSINQHPPASYSILQHPTVTSAREMLNLNFT